MTSRRKKLIRKRIGRGAKAFALVTITIIGFFAIGMMMAMFPLVIDAIRSEGTSRNVTELRNAAEFGIDYATKRLNDSLLTGTTSSIEPPAGTPSKVTEIPETLYAHLTSGTVYVKVRRMTPPEYADFRTYSSLYSPQLDPTNSSSSGKSYLDSLKPTSVSSDHWLIIESTASKGAFSRSIRAILEPRFELPDPNAIKYGPSDSSFFANSFFGNSRITAKPTDGKLTINATDQPLPALSYKLNVKTNVYADIGSNTDLFGNVYVSNIMNGAQVVASVPNQISDPNSDPSIHGRFITNGDPSQQPFSTGNNPGVKDSVRADSEQQGGGTDPPPRTDKNYSLAIEHGNNIAGDTVKLSPVIRDNTAAELPDLAALSNQGSSLPANSYKASSFTANSTNLTQPLSTSGQTRIFITDGSLASDAVSISSDLFSSPVDASNLQIFYPGNRPININLKGAPFNGVIYAPNAPVNISGSGNFSGAIVGDLVTLSNEGTVTIRNDLEDSAVAKPRNLSYKSTGTAGNPDEPVLQGYKTVTWQETTRRLVEAPKKQ